jgi:hypothetical protein
MGKKRTRAAKTSKGERRSISKSAAQMVRRNKTIAEKLMDKANAWLAGKNPWITVPGPSSDRLIVRVRANSVYGDPKHTRNANIFRGRGEE